MFELCERNRLFYLNESYRFTKKTKKINVKVWATKKMFYEQDSMGMPVRVHR